MMSVNPNWVDRVSDYIIVVVTYASFALLKIGTGAIAAIACCVLIRFVLSPIIGEGLLVDYTCIALAGLIGLHVSLRTWNDPI